MSDEPEIKHDERTPADVAMTLLNQSARIARVVTVRHMDDETPEEEGFVVEWAGNMSMYEVMGILHRGIALVCDMRKRKEEP